MSEYMQRRPGAGAPSKSKAGGPDIAKDTGPTLFDAVTSPDPQVRKEHGQTVASYATDVRVRSALDAAIDTLARTGQPFTAEDVRRIVDPVANPNVVGAAISAAAKRRTIRAVGFVTATRPEAHGRILRQWQGTGGGR